MELAHHRLLPRARQSADSEIQSESSCVLRFGGKARRVQSRRIGKDCFLSCRNWLARGRGSACGCALRDLDGGCEPSPDAQDQRSACSTCVRARSYLFLDHLRMGAHTSYPISRHRISDCCLGCTLSRSWLLRFRGDVPGVFCRLTQGISAGWLRSDSLPPIGQVRSADVPGSCNAAERVLVSGDSVPRVVIIGQNSLAEALYGASLHRHL